MEEKRHEHHGRSSKGFLNSEKILKDIGIKEGDRFFNLGSGEGYFSIAASQAVGKDGIVYAFGGFPASPLRQPIFYVSLRSL